MTVIHTNNSSGCVKETITSADWKFSYLAQKEAKFTVGLLQQRKANLVHLKLNKQNSAQTHLDNLERLIRSLRLAPWKFNPSSILEYFENRTANGGKDLKLGTYAQLFRSWRSFQSFMLELEVSNRIQKEFGIRPQQFIDETNSVALRRKNEMIIRIRNGLYLRNKLIRLMLFFRLKLFNPIIRVANILFAVDTR